MTKSKFLSLTLAFIGSLPFYSLFASPQPGTSSINLSPGVTQVSQSIYDIHMVVIWICVAVGVIVFGVMAWAMIFHRESRGYKPSNFHEHLGLEILWTIIPFLILLVLAVPATMSVREVYDSSDSEINIKVTGWQWKWQYSYLQEDIDFISELSTSADQISNKIPKGEFYLSEVTEPLVIPVDTKVRFLITSKDVLHAWWVPALGVKKDAIPGYINETWARAEKEGIYRGWCAELCGKNHAFMPVVVRVVSKKEYKKWVSKKKAQTQAIRKLTSQVFTKNELMKMGKTVYDKSCSACHGRQGEGVAGIFPSLIKSPIVLGNVDKHIDIIINGVQGTAMQAFGSQLNEVEIAAIITYERNALGNDTGDIIQPIDIFKYKNRE